MTKSWNWNGNVEYAKCSQHIFNQYVKFAHDSKLTLKLGKYNDYPHDISDTGIWYLEDSNSYFYLTIKKGGKWINLMTSKFEKDEDDYMAETVTVNGGRAYGYFRRFCKIEDPGDININVVSAFTYCNNNYVNHRYENCVGYDRNNAYLAACKDLVVPTVLKDTDRPPEIGEIGFISNGIPIYGPSTVVCDFIFAAAVDEGMQRWYDAILVKKEEGDPNLKNYYQYAIGQMRNHNLPLYNTIIYSANRFMKSHIDENTLWSTTDSIVSLVERLDLVISKTPGDFKIEHKGSFAYKTTGYQWNYDAPSIKGFTKAKAKIYNQTHNDLFDILKPQSTEFSGIFKLTNKGYIIDETGKIV